MSTEWSMACVDCNVRFGPSLSWPHDHAKFIEHRDAIVALIPLLRETDLSLEIAGCYDGPPHPEDFVRHAGHRLRVVSEYGCWFGDCNEYEPMAGHPNCTTGRVCGKPEHHDGDHDYHDRERWPPFQERAP